MATTASTSQVIISRPAYELMRAANASIDKGLGSITLVDRADGGAIYSTASAGGFFTAASEAVKSALELSPMLDPLVGNVPTLLDASCDNFSRAYVSQGAKQAGTAQALLMTALATVGAA
jgi:hypothetical protein